MKEESFKNATSKYTANTGVGGDGLSSKGPIRSFERNCGRSEKDSLERRVVWEIVTVSLHDDVFVFS